MRSKWIAVIVAAGVIGGLAWSTSKPTEAAMVAGGSKANMSLVEQTKRVCTDYLFFKCCTNTRTGKETCKMM